MHCVVAPPLSGRWPFVTLGCPLFPSPPHIWYLSSLGGRALAAAEGPMRGERPPFLGIPVAGIYVAYVGVDYASDLWLLFRAPKKPAYAVNGIFLHIFTELHIMKE